MVQREELQALISRMKEPRRFIQVLCGPRQVGKTTLVTQLGQQLAYTSQYITADDVPAADNYWLRNAWSEARRKLSETNDNEFLLIVDEIQKLDNWSEVVKREWDTDSREGRNLKVILLGSSRLLIQQGLTESLAGRFELSTLSHWSYAEMKSEFGLTLDQYIWYGGYPGAAPLIGDEDRWKSYVKDALIEASISKDILMLTRVDKPALLKRLFEIGCHYSAQILALNKIQGELQEKGNLTTLSNYLELTDGAGLLCGLDKYCGDIIRKRASKPKFQVYNNALMSAQSNLHFEQARADHKLWGRIVESAVGVHLINNSKQKRYNVFYWNENSNEVDFVIERNGTVIAIEVKSGVRSKNNGMAKFDEAYHPKHTFTVGTDGIPLEEFLLSDPSKLFTI